MPSFIKNRFFYIPAILLTGIASYAFIFNSSPVDFNTEIKPILNRKCISCHGGVRKKGGFSLLFRHEALDTTESGKPAIVPGDPVASEMIRRLHSADPEERMPYQEEPLTEDEINLLATWIRQGAKWGDHWAYVPVKPVSVPVPTGNFFGLIPATSNTWVKNEIDYFILDKLKETELQVSAQADRYTLLRRVSLDLTGLPAPRHLADKFLADSSDASYTELVDSLLAQHAYGERWTALWLDLARYADTKGYERDDSRTIWRYRDWLIKAFNLDKPYDSFLTEQLAGDLLPDATDEQLLATAFHRNTLTNDEGGTENEEFRVSAVIDRVNTTWEALMGTSFSCVQCHSHPYDPFKHEDYYRFMAFFNDTRDEDSFADYPLLHEYRKSDSLKFQKLAGWLSAEVTPAEAREVIFFLRTWQPAVNSLVADSFANSELADTKWLIMRKNSGARIRHIDLEDKTSLLMRSMAWNGKGTLTIRTDSANGPLLASIPVANTKGAWQLSEWELPATKGIHDLHFAYINPLLTSADDNGIMFDWFYFTRPFPGKGRTGYDSARAWYDSLLRSTSVDVTPVMLDNPSFLHRSTHVFERGNWLVKGPVVEPGVPASLHRFPAGAPANRLGLAHWIVSPENPLTARTMVNRLWEQLFGQAIAETIEDLGTQGIGPTHPALLDYLSWSFMHDYNWSIKKLLRTMVLSATYRQDSRVNAESLRKDPFNHYYARGARVRLTAEQVRDQALAVSGLLSKKMYGPSVMPYQPAGIWLSPWNGRTWERSTGEDQYRRAIYTYWKRSSPYPSLMSFDGVPREVCTARRIRTNTPLQALTTLNDSVYIETSRFLAFRLKKQFAADVGQMIAAGYREVTGRPVIPARQRVLEKLYVEALDRFRNDPDKTCEMTGLQDEHNNPETAALVVVTNALFNLDEVLTKN